MASARYRLGATTLGNVGQEVLEGGGRSYAIMEIITTAVLLIYLFSSREQMFEISERIQNGATRRLRAADFTVMVSHVPPTWSSNRLRAFFERWGEVVHVGVSLNYRELILEIAQIQNLRNLHTDNLLDLASKMETAKVQRARVKLLQEELDNLIAESSTPRPEGSGSLEEGTAGRQATVKETRQNTTTRSANLYEQASKKAELKLAEKEKSRGEAALRKARILTKRSHQVLQHNDKQIKQLMRRRYHCTGFAFVI